MNDWDSINTQSESEKTDFFKVDVVACLEDIKILLKQIYLKLEEDKE